MAAAAAASEFGYMEVTGFCSLDPTRGGCSECGVDDQTLVGTKKAIEREAADLNPRCEFTDFIPLPLSLRLPDDWFMVSRSCDCKCYGCNDGNHCLNGDHPSRCSAMLDFRRLIVLCQMPQRVMQQTCDGCGKRHTGSDGSYLVCCCVDFLLAHLPPDTIVPRMSLANGELLATEVASDGSS